MPDPVPTDWLPAGFSRHDVKVDDKRYFVAVGGSGPNLVLLHGWPQTSRAWRHVMPELARTQTVVVPDLLGAGNSEIADDGYAKVDQAKDLSDLLKALELPRGAHVVGHDIGAMVALAWAASRSDEVASLTVVDVAFPGLGLEEMVTASEGAMWHFDFFAAPFPFPEMLLDGHVAEFFTTTFHALSNDGTFTDADIAYHVNAYSGRERLRGGFEQYRAFRRDAVDFRRLLKSTRLRMPVLAIGGSSMGERVAGALRSRAVDVTGRVAPTGHFVAEEDPAWFTHALRELLARH
ncbi:alpha/beta fold hydrolase [Plantactinospora sp. WMMB334]|uniref:alpha/beta fold hydrolase n=1 Tax=Plantactinospora sp. WMMB334 TaxID=3404119 RepID=UPI003B928EE4